MNKKSNPTGLLALVLLLLALTFSRMPFSAAQNSTLNSTLNNSYNLSVNSINITIGTNPVSLSNITPSSLNGSVKITNITKISLPAPNGSTYLSLISLSVANFLRNATINMSVVVKCGLVDLQPFVLQNGAWVHITPSTLMQSSCMLRFKLPARSTLIALASYPAPIATKSAPVQEAPAATTPASAGSSAANDRPFFLWVGTIIIVAVLEISFVVSLSRRIS